MLASGLRVWLRGPVFLGAELVSWPRGRFRRLGSALVLRAGRPSFGLGVLPSGRTEFSGREPSSRRRTTGGQSQSRLSGWLRRSPPRDDGTGPHGFLRMPPWSSPMCPSGCGGAGRGSDWRSLGACRRWVPLRGCLVVELSSGPRESAMPPRSRGSFGRRSACFSGILVPLGASGAQGGERQSAPCPDSSLRGPRGLRRSVAFGWLVAFGWPVAFGWLDGVGRVESAGSGPAPAGSCSPAGT